MNILLVPDASVNREAAAVYRVKMSQTSLGLHSKCISMCKHTLQYSGTLTHKKTTSALVVSAGEGAII